MANFRCPGCKQIIRRRLKEELKSARTPAGNLRSFCCSAGKTVVMRRVK